MAPQTRLPTTPHERVFAVEETDSGLFAKNIIKAHGARITGREQQGGKFDGDTSVLERKHVEIRATVHVGKESNNLGSPEMIGVQDDDCVIYKDDYALISKHKELVLTAKPKDVNHSPS